MDSSKPAGIHRVFRYGSTIPLVSQTGNRQVFSSERNFRFTTYNGRSHNDHALITFISFSSKIFQHKGEGKP